MELKMELKELVSTDYLYLSSSEEEDNDKEDSFYIYINPEYIMETKRVKDMSSEGISKFHSNLLQLGYKITDNEIGDDETGNKDKANYVCFVLWNPCMNDENENSSKKIWKDNRWDRFYADNEDSLLEYIESLHRFKYTSLFIFTIQGKNITNEYENIQSIIPKPDALISKSLQLSLQIDYSEKNTYSRYSFNHYKEFETRLIELGYEITNNESGVSTALEEDNKEAKYVIFMQWEPSGEEKIWKEVKWDKLYFDEDEMEEYISEILCGGMYTSMFVFEKDTNEKADISSRKDVISIIFDPNSTIEESIEI